MSWRKTTPARHKRVSPSCPTRATKTRSWRSRTTSSSATGSFLRRYSSRPLPPYRHEPGKTPHPERDPRGHLYQPDENDARRDDDYFYAVDLFNAGYFWEAHVYWERLWSASPAPRAAELLQGLIQLSAAMVKRRAGNRVGEGKLMTKAIEKLRAVEEASGDVFMGVRVDELLDSIERGDVPVIELQL